MRVQCVVVCVDLRGWSYACLWDSVYVCLLWCLWRSWFVCVCLIVCLWASVCLFGCLLVCLFVWLVVCVRD